MSYHTFPKIVTASYILDLEEQHEEQINNLKHISPAMWNEFANLVINDTSLFAICQKHMSTPLTQQIFLIDTEKCFNDFVSSMSTDWQNNYNDYTTYYPIILGHLAIAINNNK